MEFVIGMVAVVVLWYCVDHYQEWAKTFYKSNLEMKLQQVKELYDEGTITQEEYTAMRKKVLGI